MELLRPRSGGSPTKDEAYRSTSPERKKPIPPNNATSTRISSCQVSQDWTNGRGITILLLRDLRLLLSLPNLPCLFTGLYILHQYSNTTLRRSMYLALRKLLHDPDTQM